MPKVFDLPPANRCDYAHAKQNNVSRPPYPIISYTQIRRAARGHETQALNTETTKPWILNGCCVGRLILELNWHVDGTSRRKKVHFPLLNFRGPSKQPLLEILILMYPSTVNCKHWNAKSTSDASTNRKPQEHMTGIGSSHSDRELGKLAF